jgi:hypothetical protein
MLLNYYIVWFKRVAHRETIVCSSTFAYVKTWRLREYFAENITHYYNIDMAFELGGLSQACQSAKLKPSPQLPSVWRPLWPLHTSWWFPLWYDQLVFSRDQIFDSPCKFSRTLWKGGLRNVPACVRTFVICAWTKCTYIHTYIIFTVKHS